MTEMSSNIKQLQITWSDCKKHVLVILYMHFIYFFVMTEIK